MINWTICSGNSPNRHSSKWGSLLYLRPPSQNPVFLKSHTNSVFLAFRKWPAPVMDTFFMSWWFLLTRASTVIRWRAKLCSVLLNTPCDTKSFRGRLRNILYSISLQSKSCSTDFGLKSWWGKSFILLLVSYCITTWVVQMKEPLMGLP